MNDRRDKSRGAPGTTMIYTIGHSTRSFDEFLALLRREGVQQLADVRRFPASRRYPHFDRAALAASLASSGIEYSHHPALGGRRAPRPDSINVGWRNAGFRGYADYMATREFRQALNELVELGWRAPTALMCAEALPWRCHRTLIADALLVRGLDVRHILDATTSPHSLTRFAVVDGDSLTYPAERQAASEQEELFD
jgi:uncharacterized protein (DUF488 family)